MTKSALKKLAAKVPQNEDELKALLSATITAQTERESAVADRDKALNAYKAALGYDATITEKDAFIARNLEMLEAWATLNKRTRFKKAKSTVIAGSRIGWRLGNWGTELRGKTEWEDVLNFLQDLQDAANGIRLKIAEDGDREPTKAEAKVILRGDMAEEYIRVKVEVDKKAMLRDRDHRPSRALLKKAGVSFMQDETFYLEPDREGQQPATMVNT